MARDVYLTPQEMMLAIASTEQRGMSDNGQLAVLVSMLQCSALSDLAEARSLLATLVLPGVLHLGGADLLPLDAWHSVTDSAAAFVLLCCNHR
jgi:hypothetical protein